MDKNIVIDTSYEGSINMIKAIGGEVYVLNSTRSSIQKIDGNSLITVFEPDIKGRDFVLDFILDGEDVYLSNTYDEIFKLQGNSIVDTFKVFSPDKIAKIGNKLFVTSRLNQEGQVLYSINTVSKEISHIKLNSSNMKSNSKFGQTSLAVSTDKIYLLDNSTSILSILDKDLKILDEIYLPEKVNYGNISIVNDKPVILSNENEKLVIFTLEVSLQHSKKRTGIDISSIDLRTSAIDNNKVYLYDYIKEKIIIKNWNNSK
ncbi:MAG: hypothetical protein PF574_03570 [Candidatus Delongbacteria bacterium]|nr:hypothetical protein [Candidatus Delongbacteria bacterium]